VAPLLDLDEVDVAEVDPPDAPGGVPAAVWASDTLTVQALALASLDESLWTTDPGKALVTKVARVAPPAVATSMIESDYSVDPGGSVFWGPAFAPDGQPADARVVDARWTTTVLRGDTGAFQAPVLEVTTVFTFDDATPVVTQRQFKFGADRPGPDVGNSRWAVDNKAGGHDACTYSTDGLIEPSATADLDDLQALVDHVVDQEKVVVDNDLTNLERERKQACA
jgi:hypothetical protein